MQVNRNIGTNPTLGMQVNTVAGGVAASALRPVFTAAAVPSSQYIPAFCISLTYAGISGTLNMHVAATVGVTITSLYLIPLLAT